MPLNKSGCITGRTKDGKQREGILLRTRTSGFVCLKSVETMKFPGTGLKGIQDIRKMNAVTNLLLRPERNGQNQQNKIGSIKSKLTVNPNYPKPLLQFP